MSPSAQAFLASWSIPPWATLALVLTALIYLRGWDQIRRTRPGQFPPWRLACFFGGLLSLWVVVASPLDAFGNLLLTAHMAQHLVLMSITPPLLLLGAPVVPLLRGLPRWFVREALGPFFSMRWLRTLGGFLTTPVFAWIVFNAAYLGWHVPAAYELALRSNTWHQAEHSCFFITSLLFWFVVIEPWPAKPHRSRWIVLPYLLSADVINTGFSAFLCFSGRLIYPSYAAAPRIFAISPLNDQAAAGAFMWVVGSTIFLVPVVVVTLRLLSSSAKYVAVPVTHIYPSVRATIPQRPVANPPFDLLRVPVVGAFLRSRYGRQSLQAITLLIAVAIIVDGFIGHRMASMNLAGILPWTYARPIAILALIFAGNLFCMACPFTLPREIGHRLGLATRNWPRPLRNKWLPVGLLVVFFWAYESFAVWDSPRLTAWLLIVYFGGAFLIDTFFKGASFCKYVCPIGQFNFVSSLLSPLEMRARNQSTCSSCRTRDCIAGNERQRGCELQLFMPQKVGNLDCTLCMDCVKACPHDNIGIFAVSPASDLRRDPVRSSIGRLSSRLDIAAIAVVVVTSSFASAAVMVEPVASVLGRISQRIPAPALGRALSFAGAALVPLLLLIAIAGVVRLGRRFTSSKPSREVLSRFSLALLPLALGMWAAHLLFHLLSGWSTLLPGLVQAAADLGFRAAPNWSTTASPVQPDTMLTLQLLTLDAGLLLSLYIGWLMVKQLTSTLGKAVMTLAPWAVLTVALYAGGIWTLLQPMQMRDMMTM